MPQRNHAMPCRLSTELISVRHASTSLVSDADWRNQYRSASFAGATTILHSSIDAAAGNYWDGGLRQDRSG